MKSHIVKVCMALCLLVLGQSLASASTVSIMHGSGVDVTTPGADQVYHYGNNAGGTWQLAYVAATTDSTVTAIIIEDGDYTFTSSSLGLALANRTISIQGTTGTSADDVNITYMADDQPMMYLGGRDKDVRFALTADTVIDVKHLNFENRGSNSILLAAQSNGPTTGAKTCDVTLTGLTIDASLSNGKVMQLTSTSTGITDGSGTFTFLVDGGTFIGNAEGQIINRSSGSFNDNCDWTIRNATMTGVNTLLQLPNKTINDTASFSLNITGNIMKIFASVSSTLRIVDVDMRLNNASVVIEDNELVFAGSAVKNDSAPIRVRSSGGTTSSTISIQRNFIDSTALTDTDMLPPITVILGNSHIEAEVLVANNSVAMSGGGTAASTDTVNTATNASAISLDGGMIAQVYHNSVAYIGKGAFAGFHGYAGVKANIPMGSLDIQNNMFANFSGSGSDPVVVSSGAVVPTYTDSNLVIGPSFSPALGQTGASPLFVSVASPEINTDYGNSNDNGSVVTGAAAGNGGTPSVTVLALNSDVQASTYTLTCVSANGDSAIFDVEDPSSTIIGQVAQGAKGNNSPGSIFDNQIRIVVSDGGSSNTQVGDVLTVFVDTAADSAFNGVDTVADLRPLVGSASEAAIKGADSSPVSTVGLAIGNVDISNVSRTISLTTADRFDIGAYQIDQVPVELSDFTME